MLSSHKANAMINIVVKRFRSNRPRYYKSWPNDWVPFHWSRPEKIPGYYDTGDLVPLEEPTKEDLHPDFRNSEELKALDIEHPLRKMFSLDHARRVEQSKIFSQRFIDRMGVIHNVDYSNSLEAKIVSLTYSLRQVQDVIKAAGGSTNYNSKERAIANNLGNRRKRYLSELKEIHKERYERLIDALKIEPLQNLINVPYRPPFRKVQMRTLAQRYARDLKEKKVSEYMESIEKEKAEFEQYKQDTLKWIKEKEAELGVTV